MHRRAARERKKPPAYPVCFAEVSARNTESSSLISRCDGYRALCKDSNNGLPAEKHWATFSTCGSAACMYACVGCPGSVETRICVSHCAVMFNPSQDTRGENFVHASRRRRLLVAFKPVLKPLGITRTEASIAEIAMNMHTQFMNSSARSSTLWLHLIYWLYPTHIWGHTTPPDHLGKPNRRPCSCICLLQAHIQN